MSPQLKEKFLEVNGYWVPRKDIDKFGPDGVFLLDGRFIQEKS